MKRIPCPSCGALIPSFAKRCPACSWERSEDPKTESELKRVTILFADLAGYTPLSEKLDPEEVRELLDACFEVVAKAVDRYGGAIDKFVGDAVMATFGAPVAHENHPERAVLSAFAIQRSLVELSREAGLPLKMHVGVHTGEVLWGAVGGGQAQDFTVLGDAVNVASRIADHCPGGDIWVSEETQHRVRMLFDFAPSREIRVEGKTDALRVFPLLRPKAQRGRLRGIEGLSCSMVGRDRELAVLNQAFGEAIEKRRLGGVLILGDPGIGKTRLFVEFRDRFLGGRAKLCEGRCLPFGGSAYHPFGLIFSGIFGLSPNLGEEASRAKLESEVVALLGSRTVGFVDAPTALAHLLGLSGNGQAMPEGPSDHIQRQLFFVVEGVLRALAQRQPLVLVIEDLHWADSSSLGLLEHLLAFLSGTPALLVSLARPPLPDQVEFRQVLERLEGHPSVRSLPLRELSPEQSGKMVSELLELEELPHEVRERLIIAKGEGNPFFIEEIIKCLIEEGILVKEGKRWHAVGAPLGFAIPDTVGEVILSRVDRLEPQEKRVLQRAAVVGRVFWDQAVEVLVGEAVQSPLRELVLRDLVHLREGSLLAGNQEYSFKHILIQESIYESLLKRLRRSLHREFATWLEETFKGNLDSLSGLLAHHWERAEDWAKALRHYRHSGDLARKSGANRDAFASYESGLRILREQKLESPEEVPLLVGLGRTATTLGRNEQALIAYDAALGKGGEARERVAILDELGETYQRMSQYGPAVRCFEEAERLLLPGPSLDRFDLLHGKSWVAYLQGDLDRALALAQEAQGVLEATPNLTQDERDRHAARLYNLFGAFYGHLGDSEATVGWHKKSLDLSERLGNLHGVATSCNNLGGELLDLGAFTEASRFLKRSLEIDEKTGNALGSAITCYNLGEMYFLLGDLAQSRAFYQRYQDLNVKIHNRLGEGYAHIGFGDLALSEGKPQEALGHFRQAREVFREVKSEYMECSALAQMAAAHLEAKELDKAFDLCEQALAFARKTGSRTLLSECYLLLGRAKFAESRIHCADPEACLREARDHLRRTVGLAQATRSAFTQLEAGRVLAEVAMALGDREEAERSYAEANAAVEKILSGIASEEERRLFRAKHEVATLNELGARILMSERVKG